MTAVATKAMAAKLREISEKDFQRQVTGASGVVGRLKRQNRNVGARCAGEEV